MSPLVKKEIRLLLPSFLIGVALTLGNVLLKDDQFGFNAFVAVISFFSCSAIAVFIALNSFGAEISSGTFSMLLAQPMSRHRIWRTKVLLLAAALFIGGLLWCAILYLRFEVFTHPKGLGDFWDIFLGTWLFLLAIYSGALWTVLLFRQMAAAFWFTVLTPAALLMTISNLLEHYPDKVVNDVLMVVFIIYGIVGYWFAHWLFMNAQDAQWTGGTIVAPGVRGLPAWLSKPAARYHGGSHAALWRKEFQLYQSQFIMAFALLVIHLGVIVTRKLGHFPINSSLEFVLESFWLLWFVMPFLAGCAAVAEERKFGTHESQLCLPARRRMQFTVKLSVVLLLSLLFGAAMPLLTEGTRVLPDAHIKLFDAFLAQLEMSRIPLQALKQSFFWICLGQINHFMPLLTLVGIATGIGLVSFYISTLARNTLQAMGPAVTGLILFVLLMTAAQVSEFASHPLWRGELIYFIGLPVISLTLLALAFWNFRHLATGWQLWLRNLLILAASLVLVVVATAAIYHRAWEKLTPFEPAHGAARLVLTNPASLSEHWNEISVRLPDGKIWMAHFVPGSFSSSPVAFALGNIAVPVGAGSFIEGSNWLSVVRGGWQEQVGIKTDGSLWVSETPARQERSASGKWKLTEAGNLVRFGNETNWSSLQPVNLSVLLVKNDGTLWRWGPTKFNFRQKPWPGLRSFTPNRLGMESNWAGFFQSGYQMFLRKTDSTVWALDDNAWDTNGVTDKLDGLSLRAVTGMGHGKFYSTAEMLFGFGSELGIRDDGTFRIWADSKYDPRLREIVWSATDLAIGNTTNWLAVAGSGRKMVTLKNGGSLWFWDFSWDPRYGWDPKSEERKMQNQPPIRLGTHSDWISIASAEDGIISLAADGSLWFWQLQRPRYYYNTGWQFEPLLAPPRKPVFLGNIFNAR